MTPYIAMFPQLDERGSKSFDLFVMIFDFSVQKKGGEKRGGERGKEIFFLMHYSWL